MPEALIDLLGAEVDPKTMPVSKLSLARFRAPSGIAKGYADRPGSGPVAKTCRSCAFCVGFGRRYKCTKTCDKWSRSKATDVMVNSPACSKYARLQHDDDRSQAYFFYRLANGERIRVIRNIRKSAKAAFGDWWILDSFAFSYQHEMFDGRIHMYGMWRNRKPVRIEFSDDAIVVVSQ